MHEDLHWTNQHLEQAGSTLARSHWQFSALQELRAGLASVWTDSCADDMTRRFLNPHAHDADASLNALSEHLDCLKQTLNACRQSQDARQQASDCSQRSDHYLSEAGTIFSILDSLTNEANGLMSSSERMAAEAKRLLQLLE